METANVKHNLPCDILHDSESVFKFKKSVLTPL